VTSAQPRPPRLVGAIDLGGTKIFAALVDEHGRIIASERRPTEAAQGPDAVIERTVASLRAAAAGAGLRVEALQAVGVAAAGPVDAKRGTLTNPPNLPGWTEVPLAARLQAALGLPAVLENDANASAVGEHSFGAGRGADDMVYLTISTGIGAGLIVGGRLYGGASGAAGEVGHMMVLPDGPLCGCGRRGCLEALASGTGIAREGTAAVEARRSPLLAQLAGEWGEVTSEVVAIAAERGDAAAQAILADAALYLGIGLMNLAHLLNPAVIVIGGGATRIGPRLLDPAIEYAQTHAFPVIARALRVEMAQHGDESAALGAAALALGLANS
jgi:glucokinase